MTDGPIHEFSEHGAMIAPPQSASPIQEAVTNVVQEEKTASRRFRLEKLWDNRLVAAFATIGGGTLGFEVVKRLLHVGSLPAQLAGIGVFLLGYGAYRGLRGLVRTTVKDEKAVAHTRA